MGKQLLTIVALLFFVAASIAPMLTLAPLAATAEESTAAEEPSELLEESPGLADLDESVKTKMTAESAQHLAKVIDLCESALRAGLSDDNAVIAKQILVGTRYERATVFSSMIFDRRPPRNRWGQYQQLAVTDLEQALEHDADNTQVLMLLGRLHVLTGNDAGRAKAIEALDKVIALSSDEKERKSEALAYRAAAQSDPKKRDADLNESIELDPRNLEAVRTRAMVRVETHDYDAAIKDLETAISLDPENARMHEIMAVTLTALDKNDEAIKRLGIAIELAPENPSGYAQRSRIYYLEGKYDLAVKDSAQAIKMAPRNSAVQLLHAKNLQMDGQTKEALRVVTMMLVVNPKMASAIELRASLLAEEERYDEAIAEVKKALDRDPENMQLIGTLASLYAANKEAEKAIDMFGRLIAADLKIAPVYRGRADAYLSLGRQAEALADYQKALELDPEDAGILNNLAWLMSTSPHDSLRDGKKAVELATESCRITEYKKAYILSTLAAAHAEAGDFDKAIEWAEKAVELSGESISEQVKAELESYRRNEPWREDHSQDEDATEGDSDAANDAAAETAADDGEKPVESAPEKPQPEDNDTPADENDIDPPSGN